MQQLHLAPLEKAIDSLKEAIEFSHSELAKQDTRLFRQFRNSVIQCFEFTYELCWKMLKRQLQLDAPNSSRIDELNFNDMIREGAVRGLIHDPIAWMQFRKERNATSHTYNENMAQEVYQTAVIFIAHAEQLLLSLKEKQK